RHRGRSPFGRPLVGDDGARRRLNKCLDVFPILKEAYLFRAGGLERAHIIQKPLALIWTKQSGAAQLGERAECKGPCPTEEARIGHRSRLLRKAFLISS